MTAPEWPPRRWKACVETWPDAEDGDYNPACCRFPKSCSPYPYREQLANGVAHRDNLEPPRPTLQRLPELDAVPGADTAALELANIRRLVERHGIQPADGNGEIRSTVAMVEEALIQRPPA